MYLADHLIRVVVRVWDIKFQKMREDLVQAKFKKKKEKG